MGRYHTLGRAVLTGAALALAGLFCAKQTTTVTVGPEGKRESVVREEGDTTAYVLEFQDDDERRLFLRSFQDFLDKYPFSAIKTDTLENYVLLKVRPAPQAGPAPEAEVDKSREAEAAVAHAIDSVALRKPEFGGKVTIHSDRDFVDDDLARLVRTNPFAQPAQARNGESDKGGLLAGLFGGSSEPAPLLTATVPGPRRITLTLADTVKTAAGKVLTAFDLVQAWTEYVRKNPAEGLALFRTVRGISGFVSGQEAVVPGIAVTGNNSVTLTLDKDDPRAIERLSTSRLLPAALGLGPYAVKSASPALYTLAPNHRSLGAQPFLESCALSVSSDRNPFLSFSLGKYDCVFLVSRKDIEYARMSMSKDSYLVKMGADRYFASLNADAEDLRWYLKRSIGPADILNSFVKAEGAVIPAIESDQATGGREQEAAGFSNPPYVNRPLRILFRKTDAVSARTAEKILADLTHVNLPCQLDGQEEQGYQSVLARRDYAVAVGWVNQDVVTDKAEKLRLGTMWFNDEYDENVRLSKALEVPLFKVQRYLLCTNGVALLNGDLASLYRDKAGK